LDTVLPSRKRFCRDHRLQHVHEACDAQLLLKPWDLNMVEIVPLLDSLHRVPHVFQHFQVAHIQLAMMRPRPRHMLIIITITTMRGIVTVMTFTATVVIASVIVLVTLFE